MRMQVSASISHIDLRDVKPGVTIMKNGCFFSAWAPYAQKVVVHFFDKSEQEVSKVALSEKRGGAWFGFVEGVGPGDLYAYETIGDYDPENGLYYKEGHLLVDPYAKALSKPFIFTQDLYDNHYEEFLPKSIIIDDTTFDWQGVKKPNLTLDDLIIYEANVKGLTQLHPDIEPLYRGKYLGICAPKVLSHLKRLGITAIQLNPIYAFITEPHLAKIGLVDYWGYNPLCYFAPDPRYAVNPRNAVNEFKTMVRELHRNGIAVILDVVYNHTGEGGQGGSIISFKGFDARDFYWHPKRSDGSTDYGAYYDVTGCGNSVNVDSKTTLHLVIDSMLHWLNDMQVDGFRFDLGVTVCRESHGNSFCEFDSNCAFLKACFCNSSIYNSILIAEPWDIGPNGYRVGQFPAGWCEQNDKFRDLVRRFWSGEKGIIGEYVTRVMGSRDIYTKASRSIKSSVNFVTYHDGFTLEDLVSYNEKHNEANGENNRDGSNCNFSCNCGVEGPTDDKEILARRAQLKRNLLTTTLLGQGIPHFVYGDEFSRTQQGNNNAYCQDNEISWLKWEYTEENKNFITFISMLNQIRHESMIMRELLLKDETFSKSQHKQPYDAKWYREDGTFMSIADWNDPHTDTVGFVVGSDDEDIDEEKQECTCIVFTQREDKTLFTLPPVPDEKEWMEIFDSSSPTGIPLKTRHSSKSIVLTCPCILVFKLRNSIVSSSAIESHTRHSNRT